MEVVSGSSALHLVGIDVVAVVGGKGEYLGHIGFVVTVDAVVPFHGVALRLVEGGDFHQGEVWILAVYGDEGDVHWVMGMKKPASLRKRAKYRRCSSHRLNSNIVCAFYFFFLLNRYVTTMIKMPITFAVVVPSNVINTLSDSLKFVVSVPDKNSIRNTKSM